MIHVEDDHLGCTTSRAARLDGAGRGVGASHEGDRAGGRATRAEELLGGADAREVEAGAGAALEDEALFLVPVQDGIHRVIDGQDEACTHLLGRFGADVEPDGRVEGEDLVQQHVGELVLEDLGVRVGCEVAVFLAGFDVLADDAVDQRLEAGFTLRGADGATEVLRGDDRRRVEAPERRELDTLLLEDCLAGLPVGLDDVTKLPLHGVVRMDAFRGEHSIDRQAFARRLGALASSGALGRSCRSHASSPEM